MKHFEEIHNLFHRTWGPGLLAISEGGTRDEHLLGGINRDILMVEFNLAGLLIGGDIPIEVRFRSFVKIKCFKGCPLLVEKSPFLFSSSSQLPVSIVGCRHASIGKRMEGKTLGHRLHLDGKFVQLFTIHLSWGLG